MKILLKKIIRGTGDHRKVLVGLRGLCALLLVFALSACVNTLDQQEEEQVDTDKALESYVQLGLNYLQSNNRDLARYHLNKALEMDSDYAPALQGFALLYQSEGEPELAEKNFKAAIKKDPGFSMARNNYGTFLYDHNRYEDAYKQFDTASQDLKYERRDVALYNLGRTAVKLDKYEKAQSSLINALNLNPRLAPVMLELAEIKFNQKEYSEAKRYLDMYTKTTRQTSRSLWLGIRLERIFGNQDKEASYAMQLKNMHPYSKEYLEYKQSTELSN